MMWSGAHIEEDVEDDDHLGPRVLAVRIDAYIAEADGGRGDDHVVEREERPGHQVGLRKAHEAGEGKLLHAPDEERGREALAVVQ
jgi:hypothetical protein